MEYILINPEGFLNSLERAKVITRELYNITFPVFTQTEVNADSTLFPYITHQTMPTKLHWLWIARTLSKYILAVHWRSS